MGGAADDELAPWPLADSRAGHHPTQGGDADEIGKEYRQRPPPPPRGEWIALTKRVMLNSSRSVALKPAISAGGAAMNAKPRSA